MDISHRKVTKKIRITDLAGAPAANVKVRVKQKKHEFLFGCNAFETIPLVAAKDKSWSNAFDAIPIVTDEDRAKYDAIVQSCDMWTDLFNFGTLPFYWGSYEPVEGKVMNKSRLDAAEFLRSRGVAMKGHPLCWHTECAKWLLEYDNKTILKKQLDRIERDVTEFKGVIDMWDVINEVVIMPVFDKYDNAITRLCNEHGRVGLVKMVFDKAKECNPDATLLLNDFNTTPKYEELIAECLDAGVPITAIGIQSHQHQGYWGVDKIYDVLERFSKFGLPIHFTENTFVSGDEIPAYIEDLNDWQVENWPSTPEGEARQANQMEEMYRILFSHPQVKAITNWDFRDGAWLGAPSGVVRKDNTKKPAYNMLMNMIKKEWWTDVEVVTDAEGFATVEAFKGEYEIIIEGEDGVIDNGATLTDDVICGGRIGSKKFHIA